MDLAATRLFTDDVDGMVAFYERATGVAAERIHPLFAEVRTASGTLAIASARTAELLAGSGLRAADNHALCLDFLVDDMEATHEALRTAGIAILQAPTTMPWGNRSLLVADPDGNVLNFFTRPGA
jgi:predicted enzyme related to lactoylglutathione lyase